MMPATLERPDAPALNGLDHAPREPRAHPLTRREYRLLTEAGAFEGRRVELIGGVIYEKMAAMLGPHAMALSKTSLAFYRALGGQVVINIRLPIVLNDNSEPEPDLVLARGSDDDYAAHHPAPADILLALEVSDATLSYDRRTKASAYARAQIVEYWIVNVEERQLEIHRGPQEDSAMPLGLGLQHAFDRARKRTRRDVVEAGCGIRRRRVTAARARRNGFASAIIVCESPRL